MNIGFTGSRYGMSKAQREQFAWLMLRLKTNTFHHGAAVGADTQAAAFVRKNPGIEIVAHPASDDPLKRNREIVAACDVLIAAPLTDKEELRSGTWATVRYARAAGKPVVMLSRGKE